MRPFKNYDSQYDTDFIKISLWDTLLNRLMNITKGQLLLFMVLQVNQIPYIDDKKMNIIE